MAKCCTATCNGLSHACGKMCTCCESICTSLSECCSSVCTALGDCTSACCGAITGAFDKPFSGVAFLAVLMSVGPFGGLIYFLAKGWGADGCGKPLDTWLLITLILYVLNFIFALYLYKRMSSEDWNSHAHNPKFDAQALEEDNQHEHAKHVLLYDPWVCLFIVLALFEFAWAIVGLNWAAASSGGGGCVESSLRSASVAGAVILLVFLALFLLGCTCSLYSGQITVCLKDCNVLKCCFCWCYYPYVATLTASATLSASAALA